MSIFKWLYEQFNPPKTERKLFEEEAWRNLPHSWRTYCIQLIVPDRYALERGSVPGTMLLL